MEIKESFGQEVIRFNPPSRRSEGLAAGRVHLAPHHRGFFRHARRYRCRPRLAPAFIANSSFKEGSPAPYFEQLGQLVDDLVTVVQSPGTAQPPFQRNNDALQTSYLLGH